MTSSIKRFLITAAIGLVAFTSIGHTAQAQQSRAEMIAAATKEGRVMLYAGIVPPVLRKLKASFEQKYPGITLEFIFKPGSPMLSQIMTEESAGRHIADVVYMEITRFPPLKAKGYLARYVSPEQSAYDKKFWSDPPGYWLETLIIPMGIVYNKEAASRLATPTSFESLLNAQFKGKIAILSPATNDMMLTAFAAALEGMGQEKGEQFLKSLAAQDPLIIGPSGARIGQGVKTGEFPVGLGYVTHVYSIGGGEGGSMAFGSDSVFGIDANASAVLANAPHPNAARLLVDYINSKEVQGRLPQWGYISRRNDVAPPPALSKVDVKQARRLSPEEADKVLERLGKYFRLQTR